MVNMQIFNNDDTVIFNSDKHLYTKRITGEKLGSTTRVIQKVIPPFDRHGISLRMAKYKASIEGISVLQAQAAILAEWDGKLISATKRGNWIHDNLEEYQLTGEYDEKLSSAVEQLQPIFRNGYRYYTEARVYSLKYMIAGMSDLVVQRQKSRNSIFDFYDYKTNESKGIEFDSINRKKNPIKHYNKFLLPPLDHLEDCNYNHYALQLSIYALMATLAWNLKIGKLAILYIDNDLNLHQYPVPFMKREAIALLEHNLQLKPLPTVSETNEDDW